MSTPAPSAGGSATPAANSPSSSSAASSSSSSCWGRFWRRVRGKTSERVLLLGLDGAGKTTLLNHLMKRGTGTVPTIGFNVEVVKWPPIEIVVWDIGGQDKLRQFWRHYYHGTNAVVFVLDSTDAERFSLAGKELSNILREEELEGVSILILANKSDRTEAKKPDEISSALKCSEVLKQRRWHLQPCSAVNGTGIKDAMNWLAKNLTASPKPANTS